MRFKNPFSSLFGLTLILLLTASCDFDNEVNPNAPVVDVLPFNNNTTELNLFVTGMEAGMRNGLTSLVFAPGTVARELYIFDADPRNTEDLLGKEERTLDNNTFYLTGPYSTRYRVVKNGNILLQALNEANPIVTEAEKAGYRAFVGTINAYMLSQMLAYLGDNGVRVDVADVNNLGPFVSQEEGYSMILEMLDEAFAELSSAEFAFTLSDGFSNYQSPETFGQFNRAIAARVATQAGRYDDALELVEQSFLDIDGQLSVGPQHVFSTAAGDILNPLFKQPGQSGDQIVVHPDIVSGVQAGDSRSSKWRERTQPTDKDGLNGTQETALYPTATSPADIIRNEELILIWAEANLQTGNLEDAVTGLNVIRNANGLDDFDGDENDRDALIDELLYNRTYSLWSEGHRMFDLRRYGRLNADFLSIDREGDDVFTQFPVPLSEL